LASIRDGDAREAAGRREFVRNAGRATQPRARPRRPRAGRARPSHAPGERVAAAEAAACDRRESHSRATTTHNNARLPSLGADDGRALAGRHRDPHRRHRYPARTGPATSRPAWRGRDDLRATGAHQPVTPSRVEQPSRTVDVAYAAATIGLRGAIAQLGERLDRTQEVAGSSPASSIALLSQIRRVCATETRAPVWSAPTAPQAPAKACQLGCP
jgi:hypothetical protein